MFYSAHTGGFYSLEIHGKNIPNDAVEITNGDHAALLEAQSQGKVIQADETGAPVAVEPSSPTPEQVAQGIAQSRATAYRDEADPLFFKVQRGDAKQKEWLDKVAEIKARFPKP